MLDAAARLQARAPTMVVYSTWRTCQQAAQILGEQLYVPRERLVPEFDLLDARGVGAYETLEPESSLRSLHAEFDAVSRFARPPSTSFL